MVASTSSVAAFWGVGLWLGPAASIALIDDGEDQSEIERRRMALQMDESNRGTANIRDEIKTFFVTSQ